MQFIHQAVGGRQGEMSLAANYAKVEKFGFFLENNVIEQVRGFVFIGYTQADKFIHSHHVDVLQFVLQAFVLNLHQRGIATYEDGQNIAFVQFNQNGHNELGSAFSDGAQVGNVQTFKGETHGIQGFAQGEALLFV